MNRLLCTLALAGCFSAPTRPADDGLADAGGDGMGDGGELPVNLMFVTNGRRPGNQIVNTVTADSYCTTEAVAASLPGTYHAWVAFGASSTTAFSRLGTARGWRRTDGEPFGDTVADIVNGSLYAPPRIDQFGNDVFADIEYVLTGAEANGDPTQIDCGSMAKATVGANDADPPLWTNLTNLDCSTSVHLYCFGIDHHNPLVVPKRTPVAFLSNPVGVSLSVDSLDARCQADAISNVPGTFRAAVATSTESALDRVSMGQSRGWYRVDGTAVATSSGRDFLAPLDLMADGTRVATDVFMGAPLPNTLADLSNNCSDWSVPSGMTSTGDSRRSSTGAFVGSSNVTCATTARVYCFQTD